MTDEKMALLELIEKGADTDLVREMLHFAADRMMALEVQACTRAAHGARDLARLVYRNCYRERGWWCCVRAIASARGGIPTRSYY